MASKGTARPKGGGSYIRQKGGSLKKVEATQRADARRAARQAQKTPAAPAKTKDAKGGGDA